MPHKVERRKGSAPDLEHLVRESEPAIAAHGQRENEVVVRSRAWEEEHGPLSAAEGADGLLAPDRFPIARTPTLHQPDEQRDVEHRDAGGRRTKRP